MVNFLFHKALKTTWVRHLCSENSGPWEFIPLSLLWNIGGKLPFQCNYDVKSSYINEHLTKFYRDIILYWQELNSTTPEKKKEDILNQTIWNNRFIQINKAPVYYRNWDHACIQKIACIVNDSRNCFLLLDAFLQKYKFKCNFLQYFSLLSAIPSRWKSILKRKEHHHITDDARTQLAIFELSSKTIYNSMIKQQKCPPTAEKD